MAEDWSGESSTDRSLGRRTMLDYDLRAESRLRSNSLHAMKIWCLVALRAVCRIVPLFLPNAAIGKRLQMPSIPSLQVRLGSRG